MNEFGLTLEDDETKTSSNIIIENNKIENISCWTNEVPAVTNVVKIDGNQEEEQRVATDPRGSVFQFVRSTDEKNPPPISLNPDGTYKRNVVADMQIMVAKDISNKTNAFLEDKPELQTGNSNIGKDIIKWAEEKDVVYEPKYRCNGDSMHHVSKGMVIIRVEDTKGFKITGNKIKNVENLSFRPFDNCADYHIKTSSENKGVPQGANIRGISVSAVTGYGEDKSLISDNRLRNFSSKNANIIVGIDVQGKSDSIKINENKVNLGDESADDKYVAARLRSCVEKAKDGRELAHEIQPESDKRKVVIKDDNKFEHEVKIERRKTGLSGIDPCEKKTDKTPGSLPCKWDYGQAPGCPVLASVTIGREPSPHEEL